VTDRHHGVANREAGGVEVDIASAESEDLAASHPRHGREPPNRAEAGVLDCVEKRTEFVCIPRSDLAGRLPARTRRLLKK